MSTACSPAVIPSVSMASDPIRASITALAATA